MVLAKDNNVYFSKSKAIDSFPLTNFLKMWSIVSLSLPMIIFFFGVFKNVFNSSIFLILLF